MVLKQTDTISQRLTGWIGSFCKLQWQSIKVGKKSKVGNPDTLTTNHYIVYINVLLSSL